MTVGISAICRKDGSPHAVVAADRMVTVGESGGIEYEDNESKLKEIVSNDDVSAVAVGAGSSTYIDEIFQEVGSLLNAEENDPPSDVRTVMEYLRTAYQIRVRDTIRNQTLSPYNYSFKDLKDPNVEIPKAIQAQIADEIEQVKQTVRERVHILLAAVDTDQADIYQIVGNDSTNFSDIGYSVIGSGADSAQLTFIRRGYDRICEYEEAVFTVLEAKKQAEERQGVGRDTDMVMIGPDGLSAFNESKFGQLKDDLETIDKREREARESVISDWNMD